LSENGSIVARARRLAQSPQSFFRSGTNTLFNLPLWSIPGLTTLCDWDWLCDHTRL